MRRADGDDGGHEVGAEVRDDARVEAALRVADDVDLGRARLGQELLHVGEELRAAVVGVVERIDRGRVDDLALRRLATCLGDSVCVEAEDRRHRACADGNRCLHVAAATPDDPNRVGERERPGCDVGRVFAETVSSDECRRRESLRLEQPSCGDTDGENRGLLILGQRQLIFGSLEDDAAQRLSERGVRFLECLTADGKRVAYTSQDGAFIMAGTSLHAKQADGSGQDELLLDSKNLAAGGQATVSWPQWTPANKYLIYMLQSGPSGASVWALPNSPGAKPQLVLKPESPVGKVVFARISPDGHWLAYSFNEGSREEIYVTTFPSGEGRWQISRAGGTYPIWARDGKEIFYLAVDGHLNGTKVEPHEKSFDVGNTEALFELHNTFALGSPFDVTPDGRFMVLMPPEGTALPLTLVLNWTKDLK